MTQDQIEAIENLCNTLHGCSSSQIEKVLEQIKKEIELTLQIKFES